MPKKQEKSRITSFTRKEVISILRSARFVLRTDYFDIRKSPKKKECPKVLVITPKKSGSSPARNRFKRRITEIFRTSPLKNAAYDLVIFAKQISKLKFKALKEFFDQLIL